LKGIRLPNMKLYKAIINNLGYKTTLDDTGIKTAVNVFFEDYSGSLELSPCRKNMSNKVSIDYCCMLKFEIKPSL